MMQVLMKKIWRFLYMRKRDFALFEIILTGNMWGGAVY